MHRLEVGAADIGPGEQTIDPPLLGQEGGADHRVAAGLRPLARQPAREPRQPAGHVGLGLIDGEQHGLVLQHPGPGLTDVDPHPAEVGSPLAVHQPALHIHIGPQHGANVGAAVAAPCRDLEGEPAPGRLGQRHRQIQPHPLQVGVQRQLEAEGLVLGQGQPQGPRPVAAPLEHLEGGNVLALATAVPESLELEIRLIAVGQLLAPVIQGQRLVPQAGLEVAEVRVLVVVFESSLHLLQGQIQGGDPDAVVMEVRLSTGLDLALAIQRYVQLDRAIHGAADLDLPQRLTHGAREGRLLQVTADGLPLPLDPGIHIEVRPGGEIRDPGMHSVGSGLAEPGGAAAHVQTRVLEQQIDLQVGEWLPTGEELVGGPLQRHGDLEDPLALVVGEVTKLAIPEQVCPLGLAPLDGTAQVVHQAVAHHGQRIVAIRMGRILHVDAAGQGEEGVLEQLEAEAAGEGQVLVIQRYILAVEHPALRLAPPVEARKEAVDRDRHLEVTGGIHLALAQGQAGAAPGRGQPEVAVQFLQPGHVVPGLGLEAPELPAQGEPLPVAIGLQHQLLHLALGLGVLEGVGQAGIEARDQLAQVGHLVEIDGGHIALDAGADPL
ncbi:hypothetical protein D3C80_930990 [compost metagenome]